MVRTRTASLLLAAAIARPTAFAHQLIRHGNGQSNQDDPSMGRADVHNFAEDPTGADEIGNPCNAASSPCTSPNNACFAEDGRCTLDGTCQSKHTLCTRTMSPVCGCDGNTYNHPCYAKAVGVSVKRAGSCGKGGSRVGPAKWRNSDKTPPTRRSERS